MDMFSDIDITIKQNNCFCKLSYVLLWKTNVSCSIKVLVLIQVLMSFGIMPTVKAERTPRSERKRRDSFGMFDGYDSCSEESTSSSSSEDSEDEVVPSIPVSLPIIKNNGQVYTYPDGKAGMG